MSYERHNLLCGIKQNRHKQGEKHHHVNIIAEKAGTESNQQAQ